MAQLDPASAGPQKSSVASNQPKLNKEDVDKKKRNDLMKKRIEACKNYKKQLTSNWNTSIDYRRGKPFNSQTDEDRIAVNMDWSMTKAKQAVLYSQTPQVHVNHAPQTVQTPWVYAFEQRLNDTLVTAGIESVMDEVLPDVINAAGIGGAIVSHETITEMVDVPKIDLSMMPPEIMTMVLQSGKLPNGEEIPMESVPRTVDRRYTVTRISPVDLLWLVNFTGSDFDNSPLVGRTGRATWTEAKQRFNLDDKDKQKVIKSTGEKGTDQKLTHDIEKDKVTEEEEVEFDEIFFKAYYFMEGVKSFNQIHHMIFINGIDEPVVDEPWQGQQFDEEGKVVGAIKYPIRFLTLTYITDEAVPPSDSAIGRPQVNELIKSRTQMMLQRERSLPVRWYDVNRIDPTIQQALMRGVWQGMIPVQGAGDKSIGEIARAQTPQENFTFDSIIKGDLNETWQLGPNQLGNFGQGRQSASEANVVENNFQTRIGRERAKVAKFFVSIAEVLGGLICLYEPRESFPEGFDPSISTTLNYSILADSTVLIDSNQRLKKLMDFINFTAKSGYVNLEPVMKEIAQLSGLDPNVVIQKPSPKPPVEPNISLRLTGVEDMMNPLTLAVLMKAGQAPPPDLIEQAKKLIQLAVTPPLQPPMGPNGPMAGPDGQPMPGGPPPPGGMPPAPLDAMGVQPPMPPLPPVGEANPQMSLMPKINSRADQEV